MKKPMTTYPPLYWCTVTITVNINNNNTINPPWHRELHTLPAALWYALPVPGLELFNPPERCGLVMWSQFLKI